MSFFGGGVDKATQQYNSAKRDYNNWLMKQGLNNLQEAKAAIGLTAANDIAYDTISGQYLTADSNPYIQQVAQQGAQQVQDVYNKSYIPQALSSFASSGRYGSGLFQKSLGDMQSQMNQDVANATNQVYYQNYSQERALQEQARQRAASQYDPLNRYGQYQSMLATYNPGEPTPTTNKGSLLGSITQGALAGAMTGNPWMALGGAALGGLSYAGT